MTVLKTTELQYGLKPNDTYTIDCTQGNAIVLLPSNVNQIRPTQNVSEGDFIEIEDIHGKFSNGVEVRAPSGFTVDGKESMFIFENYAYVSFRLIGTDWVAFDTPDCKYTKSEFDIDSSSQLIANFEHLKLCKFELIFETKYSIEIARLQYNGDTIEEINYQGKDDVDFTSYVKDSKLMLNINVNSSDDTVLVRYRPITLLRK